MNHCSAIIFSLFLVNFRGGIVLSDDVEYYVSPEDMKWLFKAVDTIKMESLNSTNQKIPEFRRIGLEEIEDCLGVGSLGKVIQLAANLIPTGSDKINTRFYFVSRKYWYSKEVFRNTRLSLKHLDFNASRKTILIVHGFMSHSGAPWVTDMVKAFLEWDDVNVFLVDWSAGANTWKYWEAVQSTRTVSTDIVQFFHQLIRKTGAQPKDFYFVGHSLGAHICAFAAKQLKGVSRITGLDPAQPCYETTDKRKRLDKADAEFVDVIHTNGMIKIGFGIPEPIGHADFYPNGGMKQPGCRDVSKLPEWIQLIPSHIIKDIYLQLQEAVCNHGRAYVYFTESLKRSNCIFRGYPWDLSYQGILDSVKESCTSSPCAEMGIKAVGGNEALIRANGAYFVLTNAAAPYCHQGRDADVLSNLLDVFHMQMPKQNYENAYGHPVKPSLFVHQMVKQRLYLHGKFRTSRRPSPSLMRATEKILRYTVNCYSNFLKA